MTVELRCTRPGRRDALEETARLALAFLTVSTRPGHQPVWKDQRLRLVLSPDGLRDGCYLAERAQELLEAVQSFGIPVLRQQPSEGEVPDEWSSWWDTLPLATDLPETDLVLEIT